MHVNQRVTIKEVASQAGVSTQTVSRVINDRPDVADETRRRVRAVIERLGYQPSALARSLIRRRSHTLGVVIAGLTYIGPSYTLNGIAEQAEAMGYSILLKALPQFETDEIEPILNALLARQVDGIIWAVSEVGTNRDRLDECLPGLPVPIIFLTTCHHAPLGAGGQAVYRSGGVSPSGQAPLGAGGQGNRSVVSVDNRLGGRLATRHLLEQGYRHIAHIAGPLRWWEARQRKAGWLEALADAGIPVTDEHWVEGDWSPQSGEAGIIRLLDQYPDMDAVFVGNDQMALSVARLACRRGLSIPRDLAVVGFDGIPEAAYFWPPLTTVHQDLHELGRTAVQQAVRGIEASRNGDDGYQPELVWLKPRLIVRESSLNRS